MDGEKTKSWWETVPGVMTGVAALITSVAGLIAVLHRIPATLIAGRPIAGR
jgi:hypothetical protein